MQCPRCGAPMGPNLQICTRCGAKFPPCPRCGTVFLRASAAPAAPPAEIPPDPAPPDGVGPDVHRQLVEIVREAVSQLVESEPESPLVIEALAGELRAQREQIERLGGDAQARDAEIERLQAEVRAVEAKKEQMRAERDRALEMYKDALSARPGLKDIFRKP